LASVFVLIMIGSIGFLNLTERPRFELFHTVDVVQLLATGMCYGVALAMLATFAFARKTGA
jgi:hypothetical protein